MNNEIHTNEGAVITRLCRNHTATRAKNAVLRSRERRCNRAKWRCCFYAACAALFMWSSLPGFFSVPIFATLFALSLLDMIALEGAMDRANRQEGLYDGE